VTGGITWMKTHLQNLVRAAKGAKDNYGKNPSARLTRASSRDL
jgi:hypothetical protein